jgi:hypothetical protein
VRTPRSPGPSVATTARRHLEGTHVVDEWGLDEDWVSLAASVTSVRWSIAVGGAEHIPSHGPALLVVNHRPLAGSLAIALVGIRRATGRVIRLVGIPDVAPLGVLLRRVGGVVNHPQEVTGLLRAAQLPAVPCRAEWRLDGRVGRVDGDLIAPALTTGATVLPVAVLASPWSRGARVEIGPPVRARRRRGPLAPAELADATRAAVQRLVDEATPPGARWLV